MNLHASEDKPRLLLVEDEQDTAHLVTLIMKEQGYQVMHIADGQEAEHVIALMPPPSLILLDVQLPHCSGITLLEQIRASSYWSDRPVIMLTAVSEEHHIRKVLSLQVQGYILKPFKRDTLVKQVTTALLKNRGKTSDTNLSV